MVRWVLYPEKISDVDTGPILNDLTGEIATDAKAIAPVDTGALVASIGSAVEGETGYVYAGNEEVDYAVYQELGTRYMTAQPFLKPATYRYRS